MKTYEIGDKPLGDGSIPVKLPWFGRRTSCKPWIFWDQDVPGDIDEIATSRIESWFPESGRKQISHHLYIQDLEVIRSDGGGSSVSFLDENCVNVFPL